MGKGYFRRSRVEFAEEVQAMSRDELERVARDLFVRGDLARRRANAANEELAHERAKRRGAEFEHSRTLLKYEQLDNAGPRALAYALHQIELVREIVSPNQRPGAWSEFMSTIEETK